MTRIKELINGVEGAEVRGITKSMVEERVQVNEDVKLDKGVEGEGDSVSSNRVQIKAGIRTLCLNARSIRNKVNELMVQISTSGYDLVAITETWLQGDQDWEMNIQGYQAFKKNRQEGKGGGVALLIRDNIRVVVRDDIGSKEQNVESLWVEMRNSRGRKTLVGVVYRPPNNNVEVGRAINKQIMDACKNGTAIIMGDFNMHIDWLTQVGKGGMEEEFLECCRDSFLEQYVTELMRE